MSTLRNTATNSIRWIRENRGILETPKNLFLFLTNLCNLSCEHCFYHYELNKKSKEITIDQLTKLVRSLSGTTFVCLTGGEVMVRKDLAEAAFVLSDSGKIEHINVCTNGYYVDRIETFAVKLLEESRFQSVGFQISLDGLEETHNDIRKNKHSFSHAIESLRFLKKIQNRYPKLKFAVLTVITKHNYNQVIELLHETQKEGIPHSFSIVRSVTDVFNLDSGVSSGFDVLDKETTLGLTLDDWKVKVEEIRNTRDKYNYDHPGELNFRKFQVIIDTLEQKQRMIPCYAGSNDAVIYPNGDLSHCENTKPFANLHDYDFNLYKIWNSEKAHIMRKKITNCACTHPCNIVNSLFEHPELYSSK